MKSNGCSGGWPSSGQAGRQAKDSFTCWAQVKQKYYTHNYKIFNKPDLIASPASLNPFIFL